VALKEQKHHIQGDYQEQYLNVLEILIGSGGHAKARQTPCGGINKRKLHAL
jgi:hypothetical protein